MKKAHKIEELAKNGPIGRSALYEAIRRGELVARKRGRSTIIIDEDWDAYLNSLPRVEPLQKASA